MGSIALYWMQSRMNPELRLRLIVSGIHLSPQYGLTVRKLKPTDMRSPKAWRFFDKKDIPRRAFLARSAAVGTKTKQVKPQPNRPVLYSPVSENE